MFIGLFCNLQELGLVELLNFLGSFGLWNIIEISVQTDFLPQ